jgi:hypothetical protein
VPEQARVSATARRRVPRSRPSHDGRHGDHRGIRVEQQREDRGVHPLEREKEQAGLRGVARAAHEQAGQRRAPGKAAQRAGGPGDGDEDRGGQAEADEQEIADADVRLVGELAEDGHGPEGGGGDEAQQRSHVRGILPRHGVHSNFIHWTRTCSVAF